MSDTPLTEDDQVGAAPAFPLNFLPSGMWQRSGLTKRELFAAMAMQGLLANESWECNHLPNQTALEAVECAEALLKELSK